MTWRSTSPVAGRRRRSLPHTCVRPASPRRRLYAWTSGTTPGAAVAALELAFARPAVSVRHAQCPLAAGGLGVDPRRRVEPSPWWDSEVGGGLEWREGAMGAWHPGCRESGGGPALRVRVLPRAPRPESRGSRAAVVRGCR